MVCLKPYDANTSGFAFIADSDTPDSNYGRTRYSTGCNFQFRHPI